MLFVLSCPKCGHSNLRPSRIRKIREFLLVPMATPYRCRLCDHRELVFRMAVPRRHEEEEEVSSPAVPHEPAARTEPAPPPPPAPPPAVASQTGVGEDDSARP